MFGVLSDYRIDPRTKVDDAVITFVNNKGEKWSNEDKERMDECGLGDYVEIPVAKKEKGNDEEKKKGEVEEVDKENNKNAANKVKQYLYFSIFHFFVLFDLFSFVFFFYFCKRDTSKKMCQYGFNCYRKNPVHFNEYDHPAGFALPTFL